MFAFPTDISDLIDEFRISDRCFNYSEFVPKLYNYCLSLGFEPGKIMPACAFCSDESQGYPTLQINKHFGVFPFSHGRVGGIVATDRHRPYASHGKYLMILQASHVGYDPDTGQFGEYRRPQTEHCICTSDCGKIANVLEWYQREYLFARSHIYMERIDGVCAVTIDNQLLKDSPADGLRVHLNRIARPDSSGNVSPLRSGVRGKSFQVAQNLLAELGEDRWPQEGAAEIGDGLQPELFYYVRQIYPTPESRQEGEHRLEENLIGSMPRIMTSPAPMLMAARINTQIEFERVYHAIVREPAYQDKNVLLVTGLNIDISPAVDGRPSITKFVPWAAYYKADNGDHFVLDQSELYQTLARQSMNNPDQVDLEQSIGASYGEAPVDYLD